jgi:hypothetical protein
MGHAIILANEDREVPMSTGSYFNRRSWSAWAASLAAVVPLLTIATPSDGSPRDGFPWLPNNVNVYPTLERRIVGAQIAINPTNPLNIVVIDVEDDGYTQACQAVPQPPCVLDQTDFGPQPNGYFVDEPEFSQKGIFTSFDGGLTWKRIDISASFPAGMAYLNSKNEGGLGVTADGTFYVEFNNLDWGTPQNFSPTSGVGFIKSTDGGLTWSQPVLSQTPSDFPLMTVDLSTGTVYALTGLPFTPLGPRSTGNPNSPILTSYGDAFVAASQDGVNWTPPERTGGAQGTNQYSGANGKAVAAAHGVLATIHVETTDAACAFFVGGTAPCIVFQTSTNAGATWNRYRVPSPIAGQQALVAADPSWWGAGKFAVAVLDDDYSQWYVYTTTNAGVTWSGPTVVTDNSSLTHWNGWLNYSPNGVLGLVWRTNTQAPYPALSPYTIWAALSFDDGQTFSAPVMASQGSPAPPTPPAGAFQGGDLFQDLSGIALNDQTQSVYVGWGGWNTGERNVYISALPYSAFFNFKGRNH